MRTKQVAWIALVMIAGCAVDQAPESQIATGDDVTEGETAGAMAQEGAIVTNPVSTPDGRITVTYKVTGGRAMMGDIDLGDATEIARHAHDRANITTFDRRWPGSVIPYVIDSSVSSNTEIMAAINQWQDQTLFRFVQHTTEHDWVRFVRVPTATICQSAIGRVGQGEQLITLAPGCYRGQIMHEIGHAVGLWHEQSRADRDTYIAIDWANIEAGREGQFSKVASAGHDAFPFDFKSVMLYDAYAFAINPRFPTMWKTGTEPHETWTQNLSVLSPSDVNAAALLALPFNATTIHLQDNASGKCLSAYPDQIAGTRIYVYSCSLPWDTNEWYRYALPGSFHWRLINKSTGMCIQAGATPGSYTRQMPCVYTDTRENFTVHGIQTYWQGWNSDNTNLCLDDAGTADESPLVMQTCTDRAAQMMFAY